MTPRDARLLRAAAALAVVGMVAAFAAVDLAWRWRFTRADEIIWATARAPGRGDERMAWSADEGLRGRGARRLPPLPSLADDPRLAPLRRAAESWRHALGPRRRVVDLVCLVPDVPSFLEAVAAWDDRHYFPILIDEPGWTLPFLRAFRPARVVRYTATGDGRRASAARRNAAGPRPSAENLDRWMAAAEAVARAWTPADVPADHLPPVGAPPRGLGETPPGLVLSSPDSPMLAGAVALAAGRFQPLIRLEPALWDRDDPGGTESGGGALRYSDVLTLPQAWEFARHVEARVASVTPRYDELGDDCDFLTIAGDWPYRYDDNAEPGPARGIQALDDLIGRNLVGEPDAKGLAGSRRRWAFNGRLLGDPAASVARAMGALFLAPAMAMVWDTYAPGSPWSHYTGAPAAHLLGRAQVAPGPVVFAAGPGASLANWHRVMDPLNRFGLIWVNSTGNPADFSIPGGPGRPADLPGGTPAAVVMIHSFSAADPADPATIAGRWLAQGAYVYFGSVNEPYLQAFRKPGLVADLAIRGVPLSAALRQGEAEPLGRPWRLVYLGDPLYRLTAATPPAGADRDDDSPPAPRDRVAPDAWRQLAPAHADWLAEEVVPTAVGPGTLDGLPADRRLRWCRDAAVAELAWGPRVAPSMSGAPLAALLRQGSDWRSALKGIRRDSLDPRLRPALDELIVDVLSQSGNWDELHARLAPIPPGQRRPRIRAAMEAGAMFRLARAARDPDRKRGRARIEALRDEVARTTWPTGSAFPAQFAERAARVSGQWSVVGGH